jgi:hypothetical protein
MPTILRPLLVLVALTAAAGSAAAQSPAPPSAPAPPSRRPAPVAEVSGGWAGFGDEGIVHHALGGLGARYYLTPRLSVGPELQYMVGPGDDTDLLGTLNLVVDVLAPRFGRPRRTTPYMVVGSGFFRHTGRFLTGTYSTYEGAYTAGVGVRTWASERVFLAADARLGWEPHIRIAATVGIALR